MTLDAAGLEILSRGECLNLLGSTPIGRIVFTDRALPAVQPVNFCLFEGNIVIRTMAGSKLATAVRNAVVAFEVDDFDAELRRGWSVTAVGHARAVHEPEEIARLSQLPLSPWAPGDRDHFIVMAPEQISGRRIPPKAPVEASVPPMPDSSAGPAMT